VEGFADRDQRHALVVGEVGAHDRHLLPGLDAQRGVVERLVEAVRCRGPPAASIRLRFAIASPGSARIASAVA
jgi:hypothetical protein